MYCEELNLITKKANLTIKPNYINIPVTMWDISRVNEFNTIYSYFATQEFHDIRRTRSGGISKIGLRLPAYDIRATKNSVELTVLDACGMFRLQLRFSAFELDEEGEPIYGSKAFKIFKAKCKEYGIDLEDYAISNGIEAKGEIESPLICFERPSIANLIFENAHHIDFHNSYPAGLANTHPEFRPVIEELYKSRKLRPEYKAVLNLFVGYCQSEYCGYKWAHLSRDAINDNNRRIKELAKQLRDSGRVILAYNTDGIWYTGDIYHGKGEGPELGQWENDHTNCKIRFKSAGSYEYIENNRYFPVVRGKTTLDKMGITRDQWQWGDIYKKEASPIVWRFVPGVGVVRQEDLDEGYGKLF